MDADMGQANDDGTIVLARERPFRLGTLEVWPARREVVGPRGRVVVEPRVMQVLVALAQAGGEILGRDQLIARCWEGRIVGEDAISRVISRLRRLSEGLGPDGWTLETITKVGYRLLPAGHDPDTARPLPEAPKGPRRRELVLVAGAAGVVAVGAAGGLAWRARRSSPPHALLLYRQGREALRQGLPEDVSQATGFLRESVAEAPGYAPAWGALALAYHASLLFTPPDRQEGVATQAETAARRALELDRGQPDATAALALLAPIYRNWEKAEAGYRQVLALHSRQPVVEATYARLLCNVGRMRDAIGRARIAVAAEDFTPFYRYLLGASLWGAGRTEEAELVLAKALTRWPRYYALWFLQFYLLAHTGRAAQALAMAADRADRPLGIPSSDVDVAVLGARAVLTRASTDVAKAVEAQMRLAPEGTGYAENAIGWLSQLGRMDEAFQVARGLYFNEGFRVAERRFSQEQPRFSFRGDRPTYQLFLPPAAAMRRDPRFQTLARDTGLARYWKTVGRGPDAPEVARLFD